MTYHSILFPTPLDGAGTAQEPDYFGDLNLDQVVASITAGRDEYDLKPFFHSSLSSVDAIQYRHEVMRDLEVEEIQGSVKAFAQKMRRVREHLKLADKLFYELQKRRWFLEAVFVYCEAVQRLVEDLSSAALMSRGLAAFRQFLQDYACSDAFRSLVDWAARVGRGLESVSYCVLIKGTTVTVRRYESEPDYSSEVARTFERFAQDGAPERAARLRESHDMDSVEARVLDLVAQLYPEVFAGLEEFCARNQGFQHEKIRAFDREVQFYVACLDWAATLRRAGLELCYPVVSASSKEEIVRDGFDAALARKLAADNVPVVCNDYSLTGAERVLVVSGPNQGGKTTFGRMFGQLHHLASIGGLVPAREARLFLFDRMFTHFERTEDLANLRGKLKDDLLRLRRVLERATPRSIVIANEIFASTTLRDAVFLGTRMMEEITRLDLLGVCVTFLVELASLSEQTVSLVSTVAPDDPARRTYRIERRPADGLAYAIAIADKHRLTYERLKERIAS